MSVREPVAIDHPGEERPPILDGSRAGCARDELSLRDAGRIEADDLRSPLFCLEREETACGAHVEHAPSAQWNVTRVVVEPATQVPTLVCADRADAGQVHGMIEPAVV